ncbi:MAG: co-chaperone GroES, partial [Planctomycetota bacterium]
PDAAEEKTASGLYLPESAKEKPMQGKIVAAGPGKLNDDGSRTALAVKKGDTVLYGKYAGTEIEVDGDELKIMRESELLGVLEA